MKRPSLPPIDHWLFILATTLNVIAVGLLLQQGSSNTVVLMISTAVFVCLVGTFFSSARARGKWPNEQNENTDLVKSGAEVATSSHQTPLPEPLTNLSDSEFTPSPDAITTLKDASLEPTVAHSLVSDNPLDNREWLRIVEEVIELFDELERIGSEFDPMRLEVVRHVTSKLQELLERSGVETISEVASFNRLRHQSTNAERLIHGVTKIRTSSPGFCVGKRVFRRAVVLAEDEPLEPPE